MRSDATLIKENNNERTLDREWYMNRKFNNRGDEEEYGKRKMQSYP